MAIKNYGVIASLEELYEFTDRLTDAPAIGIDIETGYHGEDREKFAIHPETAFIVGISFTSSTDWARYIPLGHDEGENLDNKRVARWLWGILARGTAVAHNARFELRHLARFFTEHLADDIDLGQQVQASRGYFPIKSCTQVEAYLAADRERFGLKSLTEKMFGHKMTELIDLFPGLDKNKAKFLRFNTLPLTTQVIEYACEDSAWCLAIHEHYYPTVSQMPLYEVEMAIVQEVLPAMEDYGVRYDWPFMRRGADALLAFRDRYNAEIMRELSEKLGETVAINLGSSPQLSTVLYDRLGYRTNVYTDKTRELPMAERRMSTGKIALERLAKQHGVVDKIRQWRKMTRLVGTYLSKYEALYQYADDGHTHPSYLNAFVITGRFAVADPPVQQSPKTYHFDLQEATEAHAAGVEPPDGTCFKFNFRDAIIAPPNHYIIGFDLSQAELRAIAGMSKEDALLRAFANGEDVHKLTAALMLGIPVDQVDSKQRSVGKTMAFALLYGMGVKSLADRLALEVPEAQRLYDSYFSVYSRIAAWSEEQVRLGRRHGYVTSAFGRRLPIWEFLSEKDWVQQKGERACVNYPVQASATGDYVKIAMVNVHRAIQRSGLADKIHMMMNVHDALEFYVHRSVNPADVIKLLNPAVTFSVGGWPEMKADWHIAKKWGSPVEVTVNDDGSIVVNAEVAYELKPTVEIDEDTGEAVEVLPEVDRAAIEPFIAEPEPAQPPAEERVVILDLPEMPDPERWDAFITAYKAKPGSNVFSVQTPQGDLDIPYGTSLGPDDTASLAIMLALPVHCGWASDDVDHAALVQGLNF